MYKHLTAKIIPFVYISDSVLFLARRPIIVATFRIDWFVVPLSLCYAPRSLNIFTPQFLIVIYIKR